MSTSIAPPPPLSCPDLPPLTAHQSSVAPDPDSQSPRRSFSQPQFPYQFSSRTAPVSAAPSIRDSGIIRMTGRPSTAHAPGNPLIGPGSFAPMCASARTSYTRVDQTAPGTPHNEPVELDSSRYPLGVDAVTHDGILTNRPEDEDPEKADPEHDRQEVVPHMPQVALTFLLVTGKRRTMSFDPETTMGRVKELVWNAWPNEWQDERPPAPSYLRILYLGKILQDEDTLSKWSFPITQPEPSAPPPPQATIVHLSVRAVPPPAEDSPKKRFSDLDEEGAGCCGCIIC